MIRNSKILGLALVAVSAMSAMAASAASAEPALFKAKGVVAPTKAGADGKQLGAGDTFTINGIPMKCTTANLLSGEALTAGETSTEATGAITVEGCTAKVAGLTKVITVTVNGCTGVANATKNTPAGTFSVDLTIECPVGKKIEVHIYESATFPDTGKTVICTYDIGPQTINNIPLDNNAAPTPDDVIATPNNTIVLENTIKNAICGQNTVENATYKGEDTIQATNKGVLVDGSIG